jgi:hypothetical protein
MQASLCQQEQLGAAWPGLENEWRMVCWLRTVWGWKAMHVDDKVKFWLSLTRCLRHRVTRQHGVTLSQGVVACVKMCMYGVSELTVGRRAAGICDTRTVCDITFAHYCAHIVCSPTTVKA